MKKEVLVFIFDGYADWEIAYVCAELMEAGHDHVIRTISADGQPKTSMGGLRVAADYSLAEPPETFSMLILPGGMAWLTQANDHVLPLVGYALRHDILVGAICNACNFMAENGYLDTRRHTGNTLAFMQSQSPHYHGEELFVERQAVYDQGVITANGSAALEFAREILLLLKAKPEDEISAWYHLNKDGFYAAQ